MTKPSSDTLKPTEWHPSADAALRFLQQYTMPELNLWQEAFASTALSGNRLSEICLGTLNRLIKGEPVSDRYLLGLAWMMCDPQKIEFTQKSPAGEAGL